VVGRRFSLDNSLSNWRRLQSADDRSAWLGKAVRRAECFAGRAFSARGDWKWGSLQQRARHIALPNK